MNKSLLIITLALLHAALLCAQLQSDGETKQHVNKRRVPFPLESLLAPLSPGDSLNQVMEEIKGLKAQFKNSLGVFWIDTSSQWNLMYYQISGWRELAGSERMEYNKIYGAKTPQKALSGRDIYKIFAHGPGADTSHVQPEKLQMWLNNYWTPSFIGDSYLILYTSHYPNTSQSRWQDDKFYYFKKAEIEK